jgi:hypothetical protein
MGQPKKVVGVYERPPEKKHGVAMILAGVIAVVVVVAAFFMLR